MSRIRALAKESLVYGVSSLASRFLNFLLTPFYTHVLTTGEFGVNTMVFTLLAFLNIVYQFGFDSAYLRLASDTDEAGRRRLFATAFQGQAALAAGLTAVLILAADPLARLLAIPPEHAHLLRWAGAILVLDTLGVVPFAHLRLSHKAFAYSGIRMANVVVNVGMNLLLVLRLGMGLDGILLANIAASATTFLLCSPLVFRHGRALLQGPALRQLLRFGLPLVPAGLFFTVIEAAGRLVLSRLSQAEIDRLHPGMGYDVQSLIGVFSAAWKLGIFGMLLVQMYRMAWQPFFLQRHKDPDAPRLFGRVLLLLCLGVGYASVTLMVLLDWLVAVPVLGRPIIARPFWVGLPIVPWVLLAYACEAWVVHFNLGVYIAKDTRYFMWTNGVGAFVAVTGNLLLVPRLGLIGAALSACLCYLSMAVLITRRSQRHFPIEIKASVFLRVFAWLALGWTLGIAVQARPEDFPAPWRFAGLAAFWLLPLLLGLLPLAEAKALFRSRA